MKKVITMALICLISLSGVAMKNAGLIIRGTIKEAVSIKYEICLIHDDGSCTSIKQANAFKFYRFVLETGRTYEITFTKGDFTKVLYVTADAPGVFPIDVDFASKDDGAIAYNYHKRKYELSKIFREEYVTTK
jgi:hypothetical protein